MDVLEISPAALARLLAASAVCGVIISAAFMLTDIILKVLTFGGVRGYPDFRTVWQLLRAEGENTPPKRRPAVIAAVAIRDIVICTSSAILLLCANVIYNNGDFRFFTLVGFAGAALFWKITFGRPTAFAEFYIIYTLRLLCLLLLLPLKLLLKLFSSIFNWCYNGILRQIRKIEAIRYEKESLAYAGRIKANGLLTHASGKMP